MKTLGTIDEAGVVFEKIGKLWMVLDSELIRYILDLIAVLE